MISLDYSIPVVNYLDTVVTNTISSLGKDVFKRSSLLARITAAKTRKGAS